MSLKIILNFCYNNILKSLLKLFFDFGGFKIFTKLYLSFLCFFILFHCACADEISDIIKKGEIRCGVYKDIPGYSLDNKGFEIGFCKAVSYSIFGSEDAFKAIGLDADLRFKAVENGEIDVSFATPALNLKRDLTKNVVFVAPYFYDFQGFIAFKSYYNMNKKTLEDFDYKSFKDIKENVSICVAGETMNESSLKKYVSKHGKGKFKIKPYYSFLGSKRAFLRKECSILSDEMGVLKSMLEVNEYFEPAIIFDDIVEVVSSYALIKKGDMNFYYFIKNLINGLLLAELKGVNSKNIDKVLNNTNDKEILYLLGKIKGFGEGFGLKDDFLYTVIKNVGNYGEIFENNLGNKSTHKMERGLNNLYKKGGMFFPFKIYKEGEN